jgi:hypothetical protein
MKHFGNVTWPGAPFEHEARIAKKGVYAAPMTDEELRVKMKEWVENWKTLGPILEAERRERIRRSVTREEFAAFDGMALAALERFPNTPTSGLVEQQRIFMKAHSYDRTGPAR